MRLANAARDGLFVRFSRRFDDPRIRGYVLDVGEHYFLLALVSDRMWFDGFECFRIADIGDFEADEYRSFVETALAMRGEKLPAKPPISLKTIDDLLLTASREFPLVTIHREEINAQGCHVGRVVSVTGDEVRLLEINPDATWDAEPMIYRLSEITCVSFGGDYEDALYLVGGEPPTG